MSSGSELGGHLYFNERVSIKPVCDGSAVPEEASLPGDPVRVSAAFKQHLMLVRFESHDNAEP